MLVKRLSSSHIMLQVMYALIPAIGYMYYLFGEIVPIHLAVALFSAYISEFLVLRIKHTPKDRIRATLLDHSSALTAVLLALSVPFGLPLYMVFLGVFFAIVMGKHIFGGMGQNIFNPAMLGYAFLLISFPIEMTDYSYFSMGLDATSGATMLDGMKHDLSVYSGAQSMIIVNMLFALGGVYLLIRNIISWHTPIPLILTIVVLGFALEGSTMHVLFGATLFGAFFIATDGVSSPTANTGRMLYAVLIGVLTIVIREFGNYPDGFAFAVLIANMFAPLIDYYIKR